MSDTHKQDWANRSDWATHLPPRLQETWPWFSALWAYDYGDASILSNLILIEDIPEEYKNAISQIITGDRKPNLKASVKSKILAKDRAEAATLLSVCFTFRDVIKYDAINHNDPFNFADDSLRGALAISEYGTKEASEYLRSADKLGRTCMDKVAKHFDVKEDAVRNLIRDAKHRLNKWPHV